MKEPSKYKEATSEQSTHQCQELDAEWTLALLPFLSPKAKQ